MENISKHITYKEATFSNTAKRRDIQNNPGKMELEAMKLLADKIFEPVRNHFNVPIAVNSFYRNSYLNAVIGGSHTSQHKTGEAIDLDDTLGGVTNKQIFDYIKQNLDFDQLIWEYGSEKNPDWVHVSYSKNGNRKQVLKAVRVGGNTKYLPI